MEAIKSGLNAITGAFDKVMLSAKTSLMKAIEPEVSQEITEHVEEFKAKALRELPEQCETSIREQTDSNPAAWVIYKALGEDTSKLVQKLVDKLRPGIDDASRDLSAVATDVVMAQVRDGLDIDGDSSDEEGSAEKPQRGGGGGADRGLEGGSGDADEGDAMRSIERAAEKEGLSGKVPKMEEAAHDQVHPRFEELRLKVEALVPDALRAVLLDEVNEKDGEEAVEAAAGDGQDRGIGDFFSEGAGNVKSWWKNMTANSVEEAMKGVVSLIDGPIQDIVGKLVKELEEASMTAAFKTIRTQLGKFHLIDAETAQAEPTAFRQ